MTDSVQESNCITNLKMLSQEELESKIDCLLAKCRAEVDIKTTVERGSMFKNGPFQISISLAVKMKSYQDDLLYYRRRPYDVLVSVCTDNGWSIPELRTVDYIPGEGFLLSVIVNDHQLVSKWRNRRLPLAADLASANFLRYLGLWVNVRNLNLFSEWEQITSEDPSNQKKEVGDQHGYFDFMGLNVIKSENTSDDQNILKKRELSVKPSIQSQLTKLIYLILVSRGDKSHWLTDNDLAFFKRIFGDLEPQVPYDYNSMSWKSEVPCSCEQKQSKICFNHDEYFFLHVLRNYYYVEKFGPIDLQVLETLNEMKKEERDIKDWNEENLQERKTFTYGKSFEICKKVKKEEKDIIKYCNEESLQERKPLLHDMSYEMFKKVKKEEGTIAKNEIEKKSVEALIYQKTLTYKGQCPKKPPTSPFKLDETETPLKLGLKKFDLRSKIFGQVKDNELMKKEEQYRYFKKSLSCTTGLSNGKLKVGSCTSLVDGGPPKKILSTPVRCGKRPHSIITVVTFDRRKKKRKKLL